MSYFVGPNLTGSSFLLSHFRVEYYIAQCKITLGVLLYLYSVPADDLFKSYSFQDHLNWLSVLYLKPRNLCELLVCIMQFPTLMSPPHSCKANFPHHQTSTSDIYSSRSLVLNRFILTIVIKNAAFCLPTLSIPLSAFFLHKGTYKEIETI